MRWFSREKSKAQQMAEMAFVRLIDVRKQLRRKMKLLKRIEKIVRALFDRFVLIVETTVEDIEDCDKRIAYSEKAMEALRTEHQIDSEAIEVLMKRIKQVDAHCEAEIAISNYRRAGATPGPIDRGMQ